MDDDNAAPGWENKEASIDVSQGRTPYDEYPTQREFVADADDVEDAISLGEDEDDQYFYQRDEVLISVHEKSSENAVVERTPSPQRTDEFTGANDQRRSQHGDREREHLEDAPTRTSNRYPDSPPRRHSSRNNMSPPHARLTHALPPKPVTAQVPYLPPSQSSIVEATSMTTISPRAASRDAKKVNGTTPGRPGSPLPQIDLPPQWEEREPRGGGQAYYYNKQTHESTWDPPVSNIPSSGFGTSNRRRASSGSSGHNYMISSDSDTYRPQSSHPIRKHVEEKAPEVRSTTPDSKDISFQERQYRRSGDASTAEVETRSRTERREDSQGNYSSRSRYNRSPGASPVRTRRRERSLSPMAVDARPSRGPAREKDHQSFQGNRPPRDRHDHTNTDLVYQRDRLDKMSIESGYPDWNGSSRAPNPDFPRNERSTQRLTSRPVDSDELASGQHSSDHRNRPPPRRRDTSRGPPRDREPPRRIDTRENSNGHSSLIPAPRPHSGQLPREYDSSRDFPTYRSNLPPSAAASSRKDRPPFDRSASSNGPPPNVGRPNREVFNARAPDYNSRQPSHFDQRQGPERDHERLRRDPVAEGMLMRHSNSSAPESSRQLHDRPRQFDPYDRPEAYGQLPSRKRNPLPPQESSFLSAAPPNVVFIYRDGPPPLREEPRFLPKPPGWANDDPSLPRQPRFENPERAAEREKAYVARMEKEKEEAVRNALSVKPTVGKRLVRTPDMDGAEAARPKARDVGEPVASRPKSSILYNDFRTSAKSQDDGRSTYPQVPLKVDTHTDNIRTEMEPPTPKILQPISPRSARNIYQRDMTDLPEGPRSSRSEQAPKPPPYHSTRTTASSNLPFHKGPDSSRFDNSPSPAFFSSHQNQHPDERSNSNRQDNGYPDRPPRRDYRAQRDEPARPPPPPRPLSGTNNVPIGARRIPSTSGPPPPSIPPPTSAVNRVNPPAVMFDPTARPPPSTLINPPRVRELPHGQEIYQPLPLLNAPERPIPPTVIEHSQSNLPVPTNQLTVPNFETKTRRVSRFSPREPHQQLAQEGPVTSTQTKPPEVQNDISNAVHIPGLEPTRSHMPPPVLETPKPSTVNHSSVQRSQQKQPSDNRSDFDYEAWRNRYPGNRHNLEASRGRPIPLSLQPEAERESGTGHPSWGEKMANAETRSVRGDADPTAIPDDEEQPSLSRRLSDEKAKPPRHRKYVSGSFPGPDRNYTADAGSYGPVAKSAQEEHLSIKGQGERPQAQRSGQPSLLHRLSIPETDHDDAVRANSQDFRQSLRDRIVPAKREWGDMDEGDSRDGYDGEDGNDMKRLRRKNINKPKRGGRR